jgi:hypothetical protein
MARLSDHSVNERRIDGGNWPKSPSDFGVTGLASHGSTAEKASAFAESDAARTA